MAVFEYLPEQIKKTVISHVSKDEKIEMCFIAGSSLSSDKDYVVITSRRVLVMDERTLGYLGKSYVNVKENVLIDQIISVDISRTFKNKLLGQSSMGLQVDRYKYLIKNGDSKEINKAAELVRSIVNGIRNAGSFSSE